MIIPGGAGGGMWRENEAREAERLAKLSPDEFETVLRMSHAKKLIFILVLVGAVVLAAIALGFG